MAPAPAAGLFMAFPRLLMIRRSSLTRWLSLLLLGGAVAFARPGIAQEVALSPANPAEFLGFAIGEDFAEYGQIAAYARMLAEVSPLATYSRYGDSVEGREL